MVSFWWGINPEEEPSIGIQSQSIQGWTIVLTLSKKQHHRFRPGAPGSIVGARLLGLTFPFLRFALVVYGRGRTARNSLTGRSLLSAGKCALFFLGLFFIPNPLNHFHAKIPFELIISSDNY